MRLVPLSPPLAGGLAALSAVVAEVAQSPTGALSEVQVWWTVPMAFLVGLIGGLGTLIANPVLLQKKRFRSAISQIAA